MERAYNGLVQDTTGERVPETMDDLFNDVATMREIVAADQWSTFVRDIAARHPVAHLLHQDPFSRRGFCKPRGYAGDAKLLDFPSAI